MNHSTSHPHLISHKTTNGQFLITYFQTVILHYFSILTLIQRIQTLSKGSSKNGDTSVDILVSGIQAGPALLYLFLTIKSKCLLLLMKLNGLKSVSKHLICRMYLVILFKTGCI